MNEVINERDVIPIDICICTFRRSHLADTIRSVSRLILKPEWELRVIVADNDETTSARALVEEVAKETGIVLTYIHAPSLNVSVARNACLEAATAPFIAYVDDDELVTEGWLEAMMSEMKNSGADVVLGPVKAVYGNEAPDWVVKGDFHSTSPVFVEDKIITGYSGNVMLRRLSPSIEGLRFRVDLGRTGGEDTAFFSSVYKAGGKISYAPDALITEPVIAERARLGWLLHRYLRVGQTHGMLLLEQTGTQFPNRIKNIIKASVKAEFCMMAALLNAAVFGRMMAWLLRGTMHVGVVLSLARNKKTDLYEEYA